MNVNVFVINYFTRELEFLNFNETKVKSVGVMGESNTFDLKKCPAFNLFLI